MLGCFVERATGDFIGSCLRADQQLLSMSILSGVHSCRNSGVTLGPYYIALYEVRYPLFAKAACPHNDYNEHLHSDKGEGVISER